MPFVAKQDSLYFISCSLIKLNSITMQVVLLNFLWIFILPIKGESDIPECSHIKTLIQWGGRIPLETKYSIKPVKFVIVHHTVSPECKSELECSNLITNIQNYHMDTLKYSNIGYNFLVGGDGLVYEGAGWHKIGAHTFGYNTKSLGVAFIGNFSESEPSEKQLNAFKKFLKCAQLKKELTENYKLFGARQVSATQSPGLKLYQKLQEFDHFSTHIDK